MMQPLSADVMLRFIKQTLTALQQCCPTFTIRKFSRLMHAIQTILQHIEASRVLFQSLSYEKLQQQRKAPKEYVISIKRTDRNIAQMMFMRSLRLRVLSTSGSMPAFMRRWQLRIVNPRIVAAIEKLMIQPNRSYIPWQSRKSRPQLLAIIGEQLLLKQLLIPMAESRLSDCSQNHKKFLNRGLIEGVHQKKLKILIEKDF